MRLCSAPTNACRIAVTLMILLYLLASSEGLPDLSSILWLFTQ
jgi:hypothetical protein